MRCSWGWVSVVAVGMTGVMEINSALIDARYATRPCRCDESRTVPTSRVQPGLVVVDGEVVQERTEQAAAEPAPEHDLVGVCVGHAVRSHRTG